VLILITKTISGKKISRLILTANLRNIIQFINLIWIKATVA